MRLIIPDWHPARLNQWDGQHWAKRAKLKKADREFIAVYAHQQEIPKAASKRRVSLVLTLGKRQRGGDPDSYWKSVLDGLVHSGLLVDDSKEWVELGTVDYARGLHGVRQTEIVLEDL